MAFGQDGIQFAILARQLGASFERTLTLGRQQMLIDKARLMRSFRRQGEPISPSTAAALLQTGHAELLLKHLGATQVESIDASAYEDAVIEHDLNEPFGVSPPGRFTSIVDGGTLEHVFNAPTTLANCAALIDPGGHWLSISSPLSGQSGHGFYEFSPEFFFRGLPWLGFEEPLVLATAPGRAWYRVRDPDALGRRVAWRKSGPLNVFVLAKKVGEPEGGWPQQSDYSSAWTGAGQNPHGGKAQPSRFPTAIKDVAVCVRSRRRQNVGFDRVEMRDLGPSAH